MIGDFGHLFSVQLLQFMSQFFAACLDPLLSTGDSRSVGTPGLL